MSDFKTNLWLFAFIDTAHEQAVSVQPDGKRLPLLMERSKAFATSKLQIRRQLLKWVLFGWGGTENDVRAVDHRLKCVGDV